MFKFKLYKYLHWKSAVSYYIMMLNNNKVCGSLCLNANTRIYAHCIFFLNKLLVCVCVCCRCNCRSVAHILLTSFFPHYLLCLLQLSHTYTGPTDILKGWNSLGLWNSALFVFLQETSTFHYGHNNDDTEQSHSTQRVSVVAVSYSDIKVISGTDCITLLQFLINYTNTGFLHTVSCKRFMYQRQISRLKTLMKLMSTASIKTQLVHLKNTEL